MRKLLYFCIGLLLCSGLFASATFNSSVFKHYFLDKEVSFAYASLWQAAKRGDTQALSALAEEASKHADQYWLMRAASLNSLSAQLALADITVSTHDHQYWLQKAADNGHAESQFELYLIESNNQKKLELLEKAANKQYQPAIIALAKYLYEAGQLDLASVWLLKAAEFDDKSRYKLARVQWFLGEREKAVENFKQAGKGLALAKRYADTLATNIPVKIAHLVKENTRQENRCAQQLQFVATSLDSIVQATQFAQKFKQDPRFTDLPICINPSLWLQDNEIQCELVDNRQRCDLSDIASEIHDPNYTHLVLFLGAGKAYVQHGVMYLDQADTYSVFIHELAHFVGFVDEYAVSSELASAYCRVGNAPNLLIKPEDDNLLYHLPKFKRWQEMANVGENAIGQSTSEEVVDLLTFDSSQNMTEKEAHEQPSQLAMGSLQIARSRTCSKLAIDTYKPSSDITFLEHHDTNMIPEIYLKMWQDLLYQNFQQRAVAQAYYRSAFDLQTSDAAEHWASYLE